ncbi:AMDHD1 isoform 2, partial [Pongo abelii]
LVVGKDGFIKAIGPADVIRRQFSGETFEEIIDCSGKCILPVGRSHLHGNSPGRRRDPLHRGAHAPSLRGGAVPLLPATAPVHDEGWHHAGGVQEWIWPRPGDRAQDAACD